DVRKRCAVGGRHDQRHVGGRYRRRINRDGCPRRRACQGRRGPAGGVSAVLEPTERTAAGVLSIESLSLSAGSLVLTADVSLSIAAGEMVALVGESGCGKSVTAQSIMRLLPEPPIRITAGRILFGGRDLAHAS